MVLIIPNKQKSHNGWRYPNQKSVFDTIILGLPNEPKQIKVITPEIDEL